MPRTVFKTEEERKQARREYNKEYQKRWYQEHRDTCRQRSNNRHAALQRCEVLTDEDRIDPSALGRVGDYITEAMKKSTNNIYEQYVQFCKTHDMTNDENIAKAYSLARHSMGTGNCHRGFDFERVIRRVMLNAFDETSFKVYKQVPLGDYGQRKSCRIDFVVTEEDTSRFDVDLSKSVIVSCKTSYHSSWREDMHLYDKCKAYILITLDTRSIPTEELPSNVFFCTPTSDFGEHTIDMNAFTETIEAMLSNHF